MEKTILVENRAIYSTAGSGHFLLKFNQSHVVDRSFHQSEEDHVFSRKAGPALALPENRMPLLGTHLQFPVLTGRSPFQRSHRVDQIPGFELASRFRLKYAGYQGSL